MGASILSKNEESILLHDLLNRCSKIESIDISGNKGLEPLFKDEQEYKTFLQKHNKNSIKSIDINEVKGNVYLGIDAGSTTTKAALIDENNNLVYT